MAQDNLLTRSNEELLACLVGTEAAKGLVQQHCDLWELGKQQSARAFMAGLDSVCCERLAAAFELARRRERGRQDERAKLDDPGKAARFFRPLIGAASVEVFCAASLDARNRVLSVVEVTRGTLLSSLVHPREVFHAALLARAASVVVAHNHPSGDPEPSPEDKAVTRRLADAGRLLGIPLLDHVILGDGRHVSCRESDAQLLNPL